MKKSKKITFSQEVLDVIDNVVNRLAQRFVFGYHDIEDIKQQGRMFAIEGIKSYDGKRPLENFLWTHVKNRLCNYKRDTYERPQIPCTQCVHYDNDAFICTQYADIYECYVYGRWYRKNSTKKNLMSPLEYDQVQMESESGMSVSNCPHDNAVNNEMMEIVDKSIPLELRSDYLKMKAGIKLSKARKVKVQEVVKQVLIDHGYCEEET